MNLCSPATHVCVATAVLSAPRTMQSATDVPRCGAPFYHPRLLTAMRSRCHENAASGRETGLFFNASPGSPARTNEAASFGRTLFPIADQYEAADDVTP